jgi:methionyl-tRNA formyltransferase
MVMKMDVGLDTGPVALTGRIAIEPDMTAGELHDRLSESGATLILQALEKLENGPLLLATQPEDGVTYAAKIDKAETRIDWTRPAKEVHDRIRGLSPMPGAWCEIVVAGKPERLKLLRSTLAEGTGTVGEVLSDDLTIACGNGAIRLVEVQRAGGKPVSVEDFQRGAKLGAGTHLI